MKNTSILRSCWGRLLALGLLAAGCDSLAAQTINSVTLPGTSQYIYDGDETDSDALSNRHLVSASTNVTLPAGGSYRILFDILNPGSVSMGSVVASIGSYTPGVALNVTGSVNPSSRLVPHTDHRMQARLQQLSGTNWITLATSTSAPRQYWHFTNTTNVDSPVNVIATADSASYGKKHIVETMNGGRTIQVPAGYTIRRYDAYASAAVTSPVSVRFSYELRDDLNVLVHSGTQDVSVSCPSHSTASPGGLPISVASETTGNLVLQIDPPVQLASASRLYWVTTSIAHIESGSTYTQENTLTLPNQRMLHFSGVLNFGSIQTIFASIGNTPAPGTLAVPYVTTGIAVDAGFGSLAAGYTFGGGASVAVRLHDDGHAELVSGSYTVTGPIPDTDSLGSVTFQRGPITLNSVGATAAITATLPAGVGYSSSATSPWLESDLTFGSPSLTQNLDPVPAILTSAGPFYVTEETKPIRIAASGIEWQTGLGRFDLVVTGVTSVRKPLLDILNGTTVNSAAMKKKRSNDHWWNGVSGSPSSVSITATADRGGRMSGVIGLGAGSSFTTHLPYDVTLNAQTASTVTVSADQIAGSSKLAGVQPTTIRYEQTCPEADACAGGSFTTTQALSFANNELTITPDGGLHAVANITSGGLIGWGYVDTLSRPSQNVDTPFSLGNFYACGHFMRGDLNNLSLPEAPLVTSLQGRMPGALATTEMPGSPAYDAGLADYPGLNLRATGGQQGRSYLCGNPASFGPYDLKTRSKYYTRYSGVTGIHDAVNGTFPSTATLFGYNFTFSNYGLSFLSNDNVISRTSGAIVVPAPSNFQQQLEKISFTCRGSVKEAKVPTVDGLKELDYWNTDFKSLSIRFLADAACNPADARLVIGMETSAAHVQEPLYGKVGFQPNGQIIRPSDNYANITSEFSLPGTFTLDGPTGETYPISAVRGAYLNHAAANPAGPGFWNIATTIDVPFFEDLKAHLHLVGDKDSIAPVYMMGGWPRKDSGSTNYGWAAGAGNAQNYFTDSEFDAPHAGSPTGIGVDTYRNVSETGAPNDESYLCRAQQSWLDTITFDYPLDWSSSGRYFFGHKVHRNDLYVVNIQHQVDWLTAENAKMSFGAKYDGLPQIHFSNLFNKKAEEALKDANSFVDATSQQAFDELVGGVDKLADLLQDKVDDVVDEVLDQGVNQFFDQFCQDLQNALNGVGANNCQQVIDQYIRNNQLVTALNQLAKGVNQAGGIVKSIDQRLLAADQAIARITGQLADGTGVGDSMLGDLDQSGQVISDFVLNLINSHLGNVANNVGVNSIKDAIQKLVNQAKPQLGALVNQLKDIQQRIKQVRDQLNQNGGIVQQIQQIVANAVSQITGVCDSVADALEDYVCTFLQQDIPNFIAMKDKLRDKLMQKLKDYLYATQFIADIQKAVKDKAYEIKAAFDEAVDSVFAQVRHIVIDVVGKYIAQTETKINGLIGQLGDKIGAGSLTGFAHINGDSIKLLRLDGEILWKVPEELRYNGYFQIKELDSTGPNGCSPPGQPMTEVTLGAENIGLKWIAKGLKANVGGRFTFQQSEGDVVPLGFGGSLEMTEGEFTVGALKINKFGASAMFGIDNPQTSTNELEAYLAATVGVQFQKYKLAGALLLGRTCTLAPLEMVDPDVASIVGQAPFTGGYAYAEGWFPIYNAGCAFNVSIGAGVGCFYFVEGPTWGGRLFGGVSGEALCLLQIGGSLNLVGVKAGDDFRFKGTGHIFGSVGPCDACVSFDKVIKATYLNGQWDIDY